MRYLHALAAAAALAMVSAACSGVTDPSNNTDTDFTAVLQQSSGNVHEFDAKKGGEYTVKLTALAPNANTALSIFLGQVVDGLCTRILGQEGIAILNQPFALNSAITKGHYCIQVFDLAIIPQAQTYTIRVSHP